MLLRESPLYSGSRLAAFVIAGPSMTRVVNNIAHPSGEEVCRQSFRTPIHDVSQCGVD